MPDLLSRASTRKPARLEARITSEHKQLLKRAAAFEGRTVTEFVVNSALDAARRLVREHTTMQLTAQDSRVFVDAILKPPKPNARLRQAARRYQKMQTT